MLYIGVDLGGTGIKAGVVNERGEILSKGSTPTMKERPYQAIIRDIAALCEDVAKQANVAMADIAAIGVGVPGICDPKTGIIPFCTNLGWHEVPFVAEMGKYLPNRVVVDNDATVAGYAESIAGVSKGTKSSVFITLGTGVGGGILTGGRLLEGVRGLGGELGHFRLHALDGVVCTCGAIGCYERYAATTALVRGAKSAGLDLPDGRAIFEAVAAGDARAAAVLERWIDEIAQGLAGLVHIFNPQLILIGGGVSAQQTLLIDPLAAKVRGSVMPAFAQGLEIKAAALQNDAGLVGAVYYFLQNAPQ